MPLAQPKGWHPFRVLEVALLFCNGKKDRSRVQREKGGNAYEERGGWRRNERLCPRTVNTLEHAITLFTVAAGRTERIICVDAERRVTGIVSLSDLFAFIVAGDEAD